MFLVEYHIIAHETFHVHRTHFMSFSLVSTVPEKYNQKIRFLYEAWSYYSLGLQQHQLFHSVSLRYQQSAHPKSEILNTLNRM